jgi:hypothetical protein
MALIIDNNQWKVPERYSQLEALGSFRHVWLAIYLFINHKVHKNIEFFSNLSHDLNLYFPIRLC